MKKQPNNKRKDQTNRRRKMFIQCPKCQTPMIANRFEREYRCPNDDCRIVIPKYAIREELEPVEYDPELLGI